MADKQTHDYDTPDNAPIPETPSALSGYVLLLAAGAALALTLAAFASGRTGWGLIGAAVTVVVAAIAAPLIIRAGRRVTSDDDPVRRRRHAR